MCIHHKRKKNIWLQVDANICTTGQGRTYTKQGKKLSLNLTTDTRVHYIYGWYTPLPTV